MGRMSKVDKKDILYFEGLEDLLIAVMQTPDGIEQAPTYKDVIRLPIGTKLGVKGNGTSLEKWASSKMFRRVSRETKHDLALSHVGMPIALMDELKGLVAESGVTFGKNTATEHPYLAFGFIGNIENGGKKAVWYPKAQLSNVIDEEYTTEDDSALKIDDITANFAAVGLNYNQVMYASFDSNRDGAKDFDKFIAQPVYDKNQWAELIKKQPPVPNEPTGGNFINV